MASKDRTIFSDYRVCTIVVTVTATTVRELLATALDLLTKTMPPDGRVVQIALTPASDVTVEDSVWATTVALGGGGTWQFPLSCSLDRVKLKAAGNVNCVLELFFAPASEMLD